MVSGKEQFLVRSVAQSTKSLPDFKMQESMKIPTAFPSKS
jgi:hypothetical protein